MCAQSCPTLCDPLDCSPPGFSVHGISQARILERVAISFPRGSSNPGTEHGSLISPALAGRFFTLCHLGSLIKLKFALNFLLLDVPCMSRALRKSTRKENSGKGGCQHSSAT